MGMPRAQVCTYVDTAKRILRGFLALTCPTPFVCDSDLADVTFIAGTGGAKAPVVDAFPKYGRIIASKVLRKDDVSDVWRNLLSEFRKFYGAQANYGRDVMQSMRLAERVLGGEDRDGLLSGRLLEDITQSLATWREALRPKALDEYEQLVVSAIKACTPALVTAVADGDECREGAIETVENVLGTLAHMTPTIAAPLVRDLTSMITLWRSAAQKDKLEVLRSFQTLPACLLGLMCCLLVHVLCMGFPTPC